MKPGIHPETFDLEAQCACGNEIRTSSTSPELKVTICSHCHPFYTGAQKFLDAAGRIEKFQQRYNKKA